MMVNDWCPAHCMAHREYSVNICQTNQNRLTFHTRAWARKKHSGIFTQEGKTQPHEYRSCLEGGKP